jgi:hypothetical protein
MTFMIGIAVMSCCCCAISYHAFNLLLLKGCPAEATAFGMFFTGAPISDREYSLPKKIMFEAKFDGSLPIVFLIISGG